MSSASLAWFPLDWMDITFRVRIKQLDVIQRAKGVLHMQQASSVAHRPQAVRYLEQAQNCFSGALNASPNDSLLLVSSAECAARHAELCPERPEFASLVSMLLLAYCFSSSHFFLSRPGIVLIKQFHATLNPLLFASRTLVTSCRRAPTARQWNNFLPLAHLHPTPSPCCSDLHLLWSSWTRLAQGLWLRSCGAEGRTSF